MLREDGDFVVNGAIFESEERLGRDSVAVHDVGNVSSCDDQAALGAQFEKAVERSLNMANRDWIRLGSWLPGGAKQGYR